jgi:hypothetical protein
LVNTTITVVGSARQFCDNVWKHHGLPTRVISDHGPQFTAEFTMEVYRLLGICKGTVGPEASNLSEAEGVRLKLLKLLELTGNPK